MAEYVDTLVAAVNATTGLLTHSTHGDWCAVSNATVPGGTCSGVRARVGQMSCPSVVVSSFYYVLQLQVSHFPLATAHL